MKALKLVGVFALLIFSIKANSQTTPNTKDIALEKLWMLSEKISPVSENSIAGYKKFNETDPNRFYLDNPAFKAYVVDAMKRRWTHSMDGNFSEKEINFLIKLYSSQTYQKLGDVENKIWTRKETSELIEISIQQAIKKFKPVPAKK